jgi:hypothetical protein
LLDQLLAASLGQWARPQQQPVVDRAEDRVSQQSDVCIGPQLPCRLASFQISAAGCSPGTSGFASSGNAQRTR